MIEQIIFFIGAMVITLMDMLCLGILFESIKDSIRYGFDRERVVVGVVSGCVALALTLLLVEGCKYL